MPWNELHWAAFRDEAQQIKRLTGGGGILCCSRLDPDKPDAVCSSRA